MSELSQKLLYKKESIYRTSDSDKKEKIFDYAKGYMQFIDADENLNEASKAAGGNFSHEPSLGSYRNELNQFLCTTIAF